MGVSSLNYKHILVFGCIVAIALVFAGYTNHRWEDWYITYRASKNLATGHGLTFTVGERVYSYTSILGTLIPAFFCFITGNVSDDLVIWLYRILNACLLGYTGIMLLKIAVAKGFNASAQLLLLGLFATNSLIVDFSINGMEDAMMIFFLACFLSLLLIPQKISAIRLGLIFAGLIYTRPDAFIYAGSIGLGFLIFHPLVNDAVKDRTDFIKLFIKPVCIAALLYLPWVLWAWWYYGSPVPHTITAKSGIQLNTLHQFLINVYNYPFRNVYVKKSISHMFFVPANSGFGGWDNDIMVTVFPGLIAMYYFLFGRGNNEVKAISLAVFLLGFYLENISGQGAMGWYVANVTLLVIIIVSIVFHYFSKKSFFYQRTFLLWGGVGVALLFNGYVFCLGAYEMKLQQQIIETGNRKQIGLWLKDHAAKNDKVLLECLGYIGYYSNLKMYDFPGMSSYEMVAARKKLNTNEFGPLIKYLRPNWIVLRPLEVTRINKTDSGLLATNYEMKKVFDVKDKVPVNLKGKQYLLFDSQFLIFHLKSAADLNTKALQHRYNVVYKHRSLSEQGFCAVALRAFKAL